MLSNIISNSINYDNGKCYVNGVLQPNSDACTPFLSGGLILFGLLMVFLLIMLIFWVLALIHAVKHEDIKDRNMWIILLVAGVVVGFASTVTVVYYFVVMRPYKKGLARATPQPASPSSPVPASTTSEANSTGQPASPTQTEPTNDDKPQGPIIQ